MDYVRNYVGGANDGSAAVGRGVRRCVDTFVRFTGLDRYRLDSDRLMSVRGLIIIRGSVVGP